MIEQWQHGPVDRREEHFELFFAMRSESNSEAPICVALIGPPKDGVCDVQILIDRDRANAEMIVAVEKEIDFYFLELSKPDPWKYAQYRCGTSANIYSNVQWTYFTPNAQEAGIAPEDGPLSAVSEPIQVNLPASHATIGRIYERDIDLFLAEEFKVSPTFATWFLTHTPDPKHREGKVIAVEVSKIGNWGESDVVVLFERASSKERFALFIEDKINAPFQPDQQARYRLRAEAGVKEGSYSDFAIVLCSPEAYPMGEGFDARVSYEDVATFIKNASPNSARSIYRSELIAGAATKVGGGWKPQDDPETNAFWLAAYHLAIDEFEELEMKPPKFTKGQTWTYFRPIGMPTQPIHVSVLLKGDKGFAELNFAGVLCRLFSPFVKGLLEDGMTPHQTGKSTSIRIEVAPFKISHFDDQAEAQVREAFGACLRLIRLYRKHKNTLDLDATRSLPELEPPHFSVLTTG